MNIPNCFKGPLVSYIRRAEELDKDSRGESALVAYYCRTYAMQQGIMLSKTGKDPEGQEFLLKLMTRLEEDKDKIKFTEEESKMVCLSFADSVFLKADEEDRAGFADKGTARTFHAAAIFYDILQQFGPLEPEVEHKKKYCKWKAAEILKALKTGAPIQPGGYGTDASLPLAQSNPTDSFVVVEKTEHVVTPYDIPAAPQSAATPVMPSVAAATTAAVTAAAAVAAAAPKSNTPSFTPSVAPAPAPVRPAAISPAPAAAAFSRPVAASAVSNRGSKRVDPVVIEDAIELTRFALSALQAKEVDLARQRLQEALNILG